MIGVVIPAYNEEKNIADLVARLRTVLEREPQPYRICVVDDSPNTATESAVFGLSILYVHRSVRGGRGSAVIEGMKALLREGCDVVVEMDADFSHNPDEVPSLLRKQESEKHDLLIASRYLPQSRIEKWPTSRRILCRSANLLAKTLLRVPVSDYTNGFRVYSRRAVEMIVRDCGRIGKGFIPLSEILVQTYYRGFSVGETSTVFVNRVRGESSLNHNEIINAFFGLWKIYMLKQRIQMASPGTGHLSWVRRQLFRYSGETIVASVALCGSLLMLWVLFSKFGSEFYTRAGSTDTTGYLSLGKSIAEGTGFRMDGILSAMRTPIYPLFLAVFYVLHLPIWFVPIVQNLIAAVNAVLIYRIGKLFFTRRAGIIAAVLFGVEPFQTYHVNIVMTETLFLFFLLSSIMVLGEWYVRGEKIWHPFALGVLLGLTALTRPLALILEVPFLIFLAYRWYSDRRQHPRRFPLRSFVIVLVCVFFVLLPWRIRQKTVFGSSDLTNLDTELLYTRVYPIVVAEEMHVSIDQAYKHIIAELPNKIPHFDFTVFDHTFQYNAFVEQEMKPVFLRHIPALIRQYLAELFPSGIISTGYQRFFNLFYPKWYVDDPNLLQFVKDRQYVEFARAILFANNFQKILLGGGLAWVGIYILMFLGVVRGWGMVPKSHIVFFLFLIVFFTVFSIAPPVFPRYRMIAFPFIFLLLGLFFSPKQLKDSER
jgi:dolichol-phosphate mannosyltransferase